MNRGASTAAHASDPDFGSAPERRAAGKERESVVGRLRNRLISGLIVVLPVVITLWIVYWLLLTLEKFLLDPIAGWINWLRAWIQKSPTLQTLELPEWWYNMASPVLAIVLALLTLYVLGLLVRSWVYRTIDWFLLQVPLVATIYRAVRNVVGSLGSQFKGGASFKRVVLVEFPHPGMRSLGLVTNALHDATSGRSILTVYVITGLMPPTGFTLFVPEKAVTDIAWSVNDTVQAILSGGITAPATIHYFEGLSTPLAPGGGEIVDSQAKPARAPKSDGGEQTA
jgi:uncharacterized membrane protein